MIQFITGALGAGKTFHSVRLICQGLARGQTIVTNVELDRAKITRAVACEFGRWIEPEQIRIFEPEHNPEWEEEIPWGEAEGTVHVVLDETHLFYNARDWNKTATKSRRLLSFLTQSRKAGVDVTWITQEGANVDKQFRVLAEWELAIIRSDHLPLGFLGSLPFKAYIVKHVSAKGGFVVRKKWYGYSKWIFGLYKTSSMLNDEMQSLEGVVERVGLWKLRKVSWYEKLNIRVEVIFENTKTWFRKKIRRA